MEVGTFVVSIILTLLLMTFVIGIISIASLKWPRVHRFFYKLLVDHGNIILVFLVLLLLVPLTFLVFSDSLFSVQLLSIYARELWISIIFIISFVLSWKMVGQLEVIFKQFWNVFPIAKRAIMNARIIPAMLTQSVKGNKPILPSQTPVASSVWQSEIELNAALAAFDNDEVQESDVKEKEQVLSLFKWIGRGDITGLYELQEEACFGSGLHPEVRSIIERELQQIQQDRSKTISQSEIDHECEERLRTLLTEYWPKQEVELELQQAHYNEYGSEISQNWMDEYEKRLKSLSILPENWLARRMVKTGAAVEVFVHHTLSHRN